MDPIMIIFLPTAVGALASFVLSLGTSKRERMYPSTVSDPKRRKRIHISNWCAGGGIGLTVVLFMIMKLLGKV